MTTRLPRFGRNDEKKKLIADRNIAHPDCVSPLRGIYGGAAKQLEAERL